MSKVRVEDDGRTRIVTIDRPDARNAVDAETAAALYDAFSGFDDDDDVDVAVLTGAGGHFSSGADLKSVSAGAEVDRIGQEGPSPLGPVRLRLSKPVIAAIEGYAVAGGLELALWCDLRVAGQGAVLGVFCRRLGVPLVDMGTIRLPRLIGHSQAMDLILTGRGVPAPEAHSMGLVNRVVPDGMALRSALELSADLGAFPQTCLRHDRLSAIEQWDLTETEAIANEARHGRVTVSSGETVEGATRFTSGAGRHGEPLTG